MNELVAYNCDPDTEYNEVASLFLSDADTAIRQVNLTPLAHQGHGGGMETMTLGRSCFCTFVRYPLQ